MSRCFVGASLVTKPSAFCVEVSLRSNTQRPALTCMMWLGGWRSYLDVLGQERVLTTGVQILFRLPRGLLPRALVPPHQELHRPVGRHAVVQHLRGEGGSGLLLGLGLATLFTLTLTLNLALTLPLTLTLALTLALTLTLTLTSVVEHLLHEPLLV